MSGISKGAIIIGFFSVISKVMGLIRERLLASAFGASEITDAYFAAFKIPDFIFSILVLGALSAAFIPVFIHVREHEGEERAWSVAGRILSYLTLGVALMALVAYLFAPSLITLIAPGFSGETKALTIQLTRVMLISVLFFGASNVMSGLLNSFHRYVALSVAPVLYNVGIIVGIVALVPRWGPVGLGWGVVLGAFLHLVVQIPSVRRMSLGRLRFGLARDAAVKKILFLMGPRMLGLAAAQINTLVITSLASLMAVGSVAVYNFAFNLMSFPSGVIGVSFAVAAFPYFAQHAARKETEEFGARFRASIAHILALLIPLSVFLILLRAQVVRVLLGAGAFDWTDTVLTANVLGVLAVALFADGVIPLLARSFYAFQDTWTPVKIGMSAVVVNLALALSLRRFGIEGVAIAFACTQIAQCLLLLVRLRKKITLLFPVSFFAGIGKVALASAGGAGVLQLLKSPIASAVNMDTGAGVLTQGLGAGLAGCVVYYLLARYFKCPGIPTLARVIAYLRRRKS